MAEYKDKFTLDGRLRPVHGVTKAKVEAADRLLGTKGGQEAMHTGMHKNGFRFAFTWEAAIGDTVGFFQNLPQDLLTVALDTENAEVFDALFTGVTDNADMEAFTLPDGTVIPAHSKISPEAIVAAIYQLQEREVNGRKVGASRNGYNVVVPVGQKKFIDFQINRLRQVVSILPGSEGGAVLPPMAWPELSNIDIIEHDRVAANEWYVLPKQGGLRRPVLELLRLRGYTTPELRVNNATGSYVGGAVVPPFEGSFTNDTIDYRFRYPVGAVLWSDTYILHSEGTTAP
jgi:hypothetical protein